MEKALLIIDVQNIMFTYEDGVYESEKVLENISGILKKAREKEVPVIYIQHTIEEGDFMREGSEEWKIHEKIAPLSGEIVIMKHKYDSFQNTPLHETLQELGIKELFITGMQSEFCIDTACRRAFSLGYKNVLVSDAHSTFESNVLEAKKIIEHHNNTLGGRFVEIKKSAEVSF